MLGLSIFVPTIPMTSVSREIQKLIMIFDHILTIPQQYLTLVLKSVGFNTFETNLLTIPAYVIFIIGLLLLTWVSEKINERFLVASISQIWCFPLLIALEFLPKTRSPWTTWTLATLLVAQPYCHAILVAITSRNAGSVRTRAVASALYNISVQTSNIYGGNVREVQPGWFRTMLTFPDLSYSRQTVLLHR